MALFTGAVATAGCAHPEENILVLVDLNQLHAITLEQCRDPFSGNLIRFLESGAYPGGMTANEMAIYETREFLF
jgi:hypothetical protein